MKSSISINRSSASRVQRTVIIKSFPFSALGQFGFQLIGIVDSSRIRVIDALFNRIQESLLVDHLVVFGGREENTGGFSVLSDNQRMA